MRFATPFRRAVIATGSIVAACLITSTAMAAPTSSVTESRGYQNCQEAVSKEVRLLRVDSVYYIYDRDSSRGLYMNGVARRGGTSTPIRIACETTRSGRRILAVNVEDGHYVGRIIDSATVASQ